jgi:hypothetical protein
MNEEAVSWVLEDAQTLSEPYPDASCKPSRVLVPLREILNCLKEDEMNLKLNHNRTGPAVALALLMSLCGSQTLAQPLPPSYMATLSLSSDTQNLGPYSYSTNSTGVTITQQNGLVSDIGFALGQVSFSGAGIQSATPLNSNESFTVGVGAEQLTFTFTGILQDYMQVGQLAVFFGVSGDPIPYYDVSGPGLTLVSQQIDPSNNKATGLHLQFVPFFSDPAFGLLSAIDQANGLGAPSSADSAALYSLNIGDITVSAVPEPSTGALFLLGSVGMGLMSRRRLGKR